MHPFDIIILACSACCVGHMWAFYVKKDLVLAVGYFVASTTGAFAGGYLALWYFPLSGHPGIIFGGFFTAVLLVIAWHLVRKNKDRAAVYDQEIQDQS